MTRFLLLSVAAALFLATAADPAAACPNPPVPSTILTNCTFTVPSSVLAKDAQPKPLSDYLVKKIIQPMIKTLSVLDKKIEAPVRSKDIKDGSIKIPDLSADLQKVIADAAAPAPAPTAGPVPASGAAPGFARVNADGSIDGAVSKGIELVSATNGVYCLKAAADPHIITTTIDISGADGRKVISAGSAVKAGIDGGGSCAAGTNIEVVTSDAVSQSTVPAPFYLVVTA